MLNNFIHQITDGNGAAVTTILSAELLSLTGKGAADAIDEVLNIE